MLSISLFVTGSVIQHQTHTFLYSLPKPPQVPTYSLPEHMYFQHTLTPHYAAECLIYFALALLAAPSGYWINRTVFAGLLFVVVNLGITAKGTKESYVARFGRNAVGDKACMIPGVW